MRFTAGLRARLQRGKKRCYAVLRMESWMRVTDEPSSGSPRGRRVVNTVEATARADAGRPGSFLRTDEMMGMVGLDHKGLSSLSFGWRLFARYGRTGDARELFERLLELRTTRQSLGSMIQSETAAG